MNFPLLHLAGLTMGTLIIGRPGSGKTSSLARHIVEHFKAYPDQAIFVLDWSGSITDTILTLILREPWEEKEKLLRRVVYDQIGNPSWVIPLPEFSLEYGNSFEEQISRVTNNWQKLSEYLTKEAPVLGGVALKSIAPKVFSVLTSCGEAENDPWQVTEFGRFIDQTTLFTKVFNKYRVRIPERIRQFLNTRLVNVKAQEGELRTYSLSEILTAVESPVGFPRLGFHPPGWTAKEAIEKGLLVLVDGANLINQSAVQHYLFTQAYSLIMAEINKRRPNNPEDKPVSIVMDEVYSLLEIPGMAQDVGKISAIYRSRKVQLYIVIQALWQLEEKLKEQIWSLGNVMAFGVDNYHEAEEISRQLFEYNPTMVKQPAKTETQSPTTEPDHGQFNLYANWVQNLKNRECVVRRYFSERQKDAYVRHVVKTKENLNLPLAESLDEVKERKLKERGVAVQDALEVIRRRKLDEKPPQL